jgi:hypothetical protein
MWLMLIMWHEGLTMEALTANLWPLISPSRLTHQRIREAKWEN